MDQLCIKPSILATLTYFNLFHYPLKKREILLFMNAGTTPEKLDRALNELEASSMIFHLAGFYCLHNNPVLVDRRCKGNRKASLMIQQAQKAARIISSFPFVRGVALSGSLSKKFADDSSDTDFFIITAPNRLWIARTLLHIFKKFTYLVKHQERYCMNYFLDETQMTILEKNIYTATEVATILPMRGAALFDRFYSANRWTRTFLPNNHLRIAPEQELRTNWWSSLIEKLLNNRLGNAIDNLLRWLTEQSWASKARHNRRTSKGWIMSLHTGKHFAKPDPGNFQKKLLQRYESAVLEVMERYQSIDHPTGLEGLKKDAR